MDEDQGRDHGSLVEFIWGHNSVTSEVAMIESFTADDISDGFFGNINAGTYVAAEIVPEYTMYHVYEEDITPFENVAKGSLYRIEDASDKWEGRVLQLENIEKYYDDPGASNDFVMATIPDESKDAN